jgi:hypothetical protein
MVRLLALGRRPVSGAEPGTAFDPKRTLVLTLGIVVPVGVGHDGSHAELDHFSGVVFGGG